MKILTYQFPFLLAAIVSLSCSSVKNNNPLFLNSELDKNASVNTLTKKEKKATGNYCSMDKTLPDGMATI